MRLHFKYWWGLIIITRFIVSTIAPLTELFCNTKYVLVWRDYPVTTCLVQAIFGINHPRDFWKIWNCPCFNRPISKFPKMHLGNLSQIALPDIGLVVQTHIFHCNCFTDRLFKLFSKDLVMSPNIPMNSFWIVSVLCCMCYAWRLEIPTKSITLLCLFHG